MKKRILRQTPKKGVASCFAALSLCIGCSGTGQQNASIPLYVEGQALEGPIAAAGGWAVEVVDAKLAFGPLHLCAGYQAGTRCDTARAEWLDSALVDVLSPDPVAIGSLEGVTGGVRSWMYDLGITSLTTRNEALPLEAAEQLAGNSVRVEGVATKDTRRIPFVIQIPVRQEETTEVGVPLVRKSANEAFMHDITENEAGLTVTFDPSKWLDEVNFDEIDGGAEASGAAVEFGADSQGARALRNALVSRSRATFRWGAP